MTAREAVNAVARIIYAGHDDAKGFLVFALACFFGKMGISVLMGPLDKDFELELSWVTRETKGRHVRVPQDVLADAERLAKVALDEMDQS